MFYRQEAGAKQHPKSPPRLVLVYGWLFPIGREAHTDKWRRIRRFMKYLLLCLLSRNILWIFFPCLPGNFALKKGRDFGGFFSGLRFPRNEARKLLERFGENSGQNSGQNSGRKFEKSGELSFCNFSDLKTCHREGQVGDTYLQGLVLLLWQDLSVVFAVPDWREGHKICNGQVVGKPRNWGFVKGGFCEGGGGESQ